jgi:hypothetical protein
MGAKWRDLPAPSSMTVAPGMAVTGSYVSWEEGDTKASGILGAGVMGGKLAGKKAICRITEAVVSPPRHARTGLGP